MEDNLIANCEGFDREHANFEKNQKKHNVSRWECEQLFFNEPLLIHDDEKHSRSESRYFALGQTDMHRKLMIVFTIRYNTRVKMLLAEGIQLHRKDIRDK